MRFPDLSPYCNMLPQSLPGVLNVGWLDSPAFPQAEPSEEFLVALARLVAREDVNCVRTLRDCPCCEQLGIEATYGGVEFFMGNKEMWVPSPDGQFIYAAPDMVWHYVRDHRYSPPAAFREACLRFDPGSSWSGEIAHQERVDRLFRDLDEAAMKVR